MEDITYSQFIKKHPSFTGMFENLDGKYWIVDGELHREDGPAVVWADGYKAWYQNGKKHREDGPAIEYFDGAKDWYFHGNLHREDGPAMEWADGGKAWWLHGEKMSEDEHRGKVRIKKLESFLSQEED